MSNQIEIYQSADKNTQVEVRFEGETVWLTQVQLVTLFDSSKANISEHIKHIFKSGELDEKATVRKFRTVQLEGSRSVERNRTHYNLDMIISVGYRVNTKQGVQFRQWATHRLKDYLVEGYAINERRLRDLKTGIKILSRTIEDKTAAKDSNSLLNIFAKGLELLDDYDHEELDSKGITKKKSKYPKFEEYKELIVEMKTDVGSDIFGQPRDKSFESSVNQIMQSFDGKELYPSIEEKAATLLYLIVKNHSFVDGNKRIAAACFLLFLQKNGMLDLKNGNSIISNEALASLTLFVASSKHDEMETVKKLIISVLNRNQV